jgi:hypothetical protein
MIKIGITTLLLLNLTWAKVLPEDLLSANCLKDYRTKYLPIKSHKAFSYARENSTGKERCGWSYGYLNLEETKAVALKQCNKYGLKAKCSIVDVDGQFMVQTEVEKAKKKVMPSKVIPTELEQTMALAKRTVLGNCLPFFENYLKDKDFKVFAYANDTDGKYACGKTYNHRTVKSATEVALRSCYENRMERGKDGPKSICKIYAKGNNIVLEKVSSSQTLEKEIKELVKLSKVTGGKFDLKKKIEQKLKILKLEPLDKTLKLTAKTLNKNLPEMLDEELRFDKVKAVGSKMTFLYTLVHYSNKTMSPRKLHSLMYGDVKKQVCQEPASIQLLKKGMTIDYVYKGVDMKNIAVFSFDEKVCKLDIK